MHASSVRAFFVHFTSRDCNMPCTESVVVFKSNEQDSRALNWAHRKCTYEGASKCFDRHRISLTSFAGNFFRFRQWVDMT